MHPSVNPYLLNIEQIVDLYSRMSPEEKAELTTWESEHVTGANSIGTSDWPGWKGIIDKYSH